MPRLAPLVNTRTSLLASKPASTWSRSIDFDFSYSLYTADMVARVARIADGRMGCREWARRCGRLDDIHSIEDRYDHDIDELMA